MKFVNVFSEAQIGEQHCLNSRIRSVPTLSITGLGELDLGSSLHFINPLGINGRKVKKSYLESREFPTQITCPVSFGHVDSPHCSTWLNIDIVGIRTFPNAARQITFDRLVYGSTSVASN